MNVYLMNPHLYKETLPFDVKQWHNTHEKLWDLCAYLKKPFIVLDDHIVVKDYYDVFFTKISLFMKNVPENWDVLFLDVNKYTMHAQKRKHVNLHVFQVNSTHMKSKHCYIIHPKCCDFLRLLYDKKMDIRLFLSQQHSLLNIYAPTDQSGYFRIES